MSNVSTGSIMVLDTAATVLATGNPITIKALCFVAAANADDLAITDGAGKAIWTAKAGTVATAGYQTIIHFPDGGITVNGLIVATIDAGILYVYLAKAR